MKVYAILDRQSGAVKIGISANPKKRLRQLQTACAGKLEILFELKGGRHIESAFHGFMKSKQLQLTGEWFCWNVEVAGYLLDIWEADKAKKSNSPDWSKTIQHERSWYQGSDGRYSSHHFSALGFAT